MSRDADPLLYISMGIPNSVQVHKATTGKHLLTIPHTGITASNIQAL